MMKKKFLILASLGFLMFSPVFFLSTTDLEQEVVNCLEKGDVTKLSSYFDEEISTCGPDGVEYYTKDDAYIMLNNFFGFHSPKKFKVRHRGENATGDKSYLIGILSTQDLDYRFTIGFQGKKKINNIIIEREERIDYLSLSNQLSNKML